MGERDVVTEQLEVLGLHADLVELVDLGGLVEQAHDDALAVGSRNRRDAHVDLAFSEAQGGAAVLG